MKRAPLGEISFYLGRAYYNYVVLLEQLLREFRLDRHLCPGMGHILFALFERDDLIIKDIAERTQLSCSALTGMLGRMERAGVLRRRRDAQDGRAVRVRLTRLGRSLEPRCQQLVRKLNAVLEHGMTADEIAQAKDLLARMVENMRSGTLKADAAA